MIKPLACLGLLAALLGPLDARAQLAPGPIPGAVVAEPIAIGGMLAGGALWRRYSERFIDPSGRVVDDGNGGISHSEGQGYGMLIAVAAGDRVVFERMWSWTRSELGVRHDHLFGWKWDPGRSRVVDQNNASDGDLLIAWALVEAASYWNEPDYMVAAAKIAADIEGKLVRRYANPGAVLLPAALGFSEVERSDGPVVNLSYWIFPALARLAQLDGRPAWAELTKTGIGLVEKARFGPARLPVGWTSIGREEPAVARGHKIRFGYNAIRIPLYMYWSGLTSQSLFRDLVGAWDAGAGGVRVIDGDSAGLDTPLPEKGYGAIESLTRCAANDRRFPSDFYKPRENEHYFPTTLHILSIVAAISRGGPCLDQAAAGAMIGPDWRPRPAVAPHFDATQPHGDAADAPGPAAPARAPLARGVGDASNLARKTPPAAGSMDEPIGLVVLLVVLLCGSIGVVAWLRERKNDEVDAPMEVDPRPVIAAAAATSSIPSQGHLPAAPLRSATPFLEASPSVVAPHALRAPGTVRVIEETSPAQPVPRAAWSFNDPSFLKKLETAASISNRFGRAVALAALRVEGYTSDEQRYGRPDADEMIEEFVTGLKPALGLGSCVSVQRDGIVFVCLGFVDRETDLESIFEPLMDRVRMLGDAHPGLGEIHAGFSVWPVDGVDAPGLVEVAYKRCQGQAPRRGLARSA